tara:strand:- start:14470 stop:15102 length:633 start_codon:yes stop_codon:yes gene_type:complete
MKYLVIDFETTGNGVDKSNNYKSYQEDLMPLPRANYPIQLAAALLNEQGDIVKRDNMIIHGAERLDPFVLENCPHLSVKVCQEQGIPFVQVLKRLTDMIDDEPTTIVAHNIKYDWNDVILETVKEQNLMDNTFFEQLNRCERFCTCVNSDTKAKGTAYYYKKIRRWIGPSLKNLAKQNNVIYDEEKAHDAEYDVDLTAKCLVKCYPSMFQ